MALHEVQLKGYSVRPGNLSLGTYDSYGIEQLHVTLDDTWSGLAIDATFHNTPNDKGVTMLVDADGLVPVPPEACMRASKYATITFRGVQDGVQRISCNLPYVVLDHAQVPGANSTATPSENAQALAQMQDLRDGAVDAKRHAEAARDAAANSATAAAASEKAAASSAVAAAGSAAQAEAQKTTAAKSANDAQGYMQTASGAATAANASAKNAEGSKAAAASSATAAAGSATAAAGDAKTASDAAAGAADAKAAAVAAQKDAAASKAAAANSSAAAKTSEDAAAKSAADADNTANSIKDSMTQIAANKEAISQLEEDTTALQKRQNVLVGSETGNLVSCDDAFAAPLCGLTVYGRSTQDGTPTPDAPVPIVSAGDGGTIAVKVTGVNLIDLNEIFDLVREQSQSTVKDGHITGTTKSMYAQIGFILKGKLSAQYTVSVSGGAAGLSTELRVYIWDNNSLANNVASKTVPAGERASCTFKADGKHEYAVWFRPNGMGDYDFYDVQLELGKTATTYSPYREQLLTLPTPTGLPGIPVTSGGNYTDQNGYQWVCDEVDLERGVKVQRVNAVDLSTCVITGTTNLTATKRLAIRLPLKGKDYQVKALCNRLPYLVSFTSDTIHFYVDTNNAQVFIPIGAKNPEEGEYILFYALATPIETPLTPAEIAAYKALTTYAPDTVVQASDGAGIKLDYQRDVNLVVKNLEDAIASMTTT